MAHYPVNHHLRPMYRGLAALAGAYLVVFGVVGFITVGGDGLFGHPEDRILGQGGNLAWSILSLVIGAIVVGTTVLGNNKDTNAHRFLGWALMVIGSYELAVSRTDANFLDFSISTVVVTYLVGLALLTAGLYTKIERPENAGAPRQVREGRTA